MSSTTRWFGYVVKAGGAGTAGRWCVCCARCAIRSAALVDLGDPGFGVYVTPSYLLIHRKPLILRKISDRSRATVSLESAWSAKMTLVLAAVWLLLDYPWGLLDGRTPKPDPGGYFP